MIPKNQNSLLNLVRTSRLCHKTVRRGEKTWQLKAAVCLERHALISPPMSDLQKRYSDLISQIEYEQSLLSSHEVRRVQDQIRAQKLASGEIEAEETEKHVQTAQDFEDVAKEERSQFRIAERLEQAIQDTKSLHRSPSEKVILVVKQKEDNRDISLENLRWIFPCALHSHGETLRQTAEKVISNLPQVKIIGNAPVGFYKYKYPKGLATVSSEYIGAKVFFYKAHLLSVSNFQFDNLKILDFKWLHHKELSEHFTTKYQKSVSKFLMD